MREAGIATTPCPAISPLRMRVSMSAIGSEWVIRCLSFRSRRAPPPLPRGLRHAGDSPRQGLLAEANPAHLELAHITARSAAQAAAVAHLHRVLAAGLTNDNRFLGHAQAPFW